MIWEKRKKNWISFEPSKILIWVANAIPYGVCACVRATRFHPYGMTEMPCLGIEWKIRIIFSDTTSYVYKLYSVYFVSVCRFDIWQEFNQARFSLSPKLEPLLSFARSLPFGNPIFISATNQAKQRFVEMHLNESNMGRLLCECVYYVCSQDILRFMSLVRKNRSALILFFRREHFRNRFEEMCLIYSNGLAISHFKILSSWNRLKRASNTNSKIWFPFPDNCFFILIFCRFSAVHSPLWWLR